MIVDGFPDREIKVNGKSFLYFGGTNYLGLATHPEFQNNLISSIKNGEQAMVVRAMPI